MVKAFKGYTESIQAKKNANNGEIH